MNVSSMEFNWSIDLLYNITTNISIIGSNTIISPYLLVGVKKINGDILIKRITINPIPLLLPLPIMPMSGNNVSQTHVSTMLSKKTFPTNKYTTESFVTDSYNIQSVAIDYNNKKYLSLNKQLNQFVDISNNLYIGDINAVYRDDMYSTNVHQTIAISRNNTRYIHNSQKLYAINADTSFT